MAETPISNSLDLIVDEIVDDPYVPTGDISRHARTVAYLKKLCRIVLLLSLTSVTILIANSIKS